jgi:hypothetical protein
MENLPAKSLDLLRQLETNYPDRVDVRERSPYEQGKQHGVIELIRYLQRLEKGED